SETEKVDAEQRKMVVYSRIEHNSKISENLKKTKGEIEGLERHYLTIKNLSDTANGDLQGKQRLAFERYIQAFYFNRVLMEANKRFSYMTNKRFELVRKDEASDMRSHSGLEIDVMDHYTGKTRSVKSLSGGESFKASLALALGLSDMIQTHAGGVQMDTMFVDEGFGALDSESLEQAIDVLNALTHGNRLVGIISHVSELREKIDRKIVVKKGNTGSYVELV
ncbi:MAG TPA: SbcC/MukB-like Walker B domain-containing protein, partial [Fusibacter sp.]|nr:SbcC/MukB-like Walker B domain-containing protein [Fusibacter sp.]